MKLKKLIPLALKKFLIRALQNRSKHLSQAGQDMWVYGEVFNEKREGYFLDIGAHDGISISNTYLLETRYQWSGICIEANPFVFKKLVTTRNSKCLNICLDRAEGEVDFVLRDDWSGIVSEDVDNKIDESSTREVIKLKTTTLASVLEEANSPKVIDYLSIDVEGAEERVLSDFDFETYCFKCITIERPSEHLQSLFNAHGYVLIKCIPGLDSFYVHKDFVDDYRRNTISYYSRLNFFWRWR